MALIEITVDHPSLISTAEDERRTTDEEEGGLLSRDGEQQDEPAEATDPAGTADHGLGETLKTVSTVLTAVTTIAGVLKQLRSEDEDGSAVEVAEGLFEDEDVGGQDEVESFEEELVEDDNEDGLGDESEAAVDEEGESDEDSSGLGLKVAFVLVVLLVALALWTRGDDEESVDDDWD